jgi:ribosome biogenesis GTPase
MIARVLTRRTRFSRAAAGRESQEQVAAANIDTVLLVSSLNREFNLRRIERYLSLAWESGARPIIVLNKADLCDDVDAWRHSAVSAGQGVPVLVTSAVRGDGLSAVAEAVSRGGTTALLGSSGVGKSTLLTALVGEAHQSVTAIRAGDDRGRHRTTARQLFVAPTGGVLIDTPGMRELQLWDAASGLDHAFADIVQLASECRFRDCAHQSEPDCAVREAVAAGRLDTGRLEHYRRLKREERFVESRQDERLRLARAKQMKRLSKAAREVYRLKNR